jgi:hypothetical protein
MHQCDCCDYYSLAEKGACLVCPVCFWEDDSLVFFELGLDLESDLNNDLTLRKARGNFQFFGAYENKFISLVVCKKERDSLRFEARNT